MSIDPTKPEHFQDAVVTVMGLGRYKQGSGIGSAKWLLRHGAQIVITDMKDEKDLKESVEEVSKWYDQYKQEYPDRDIYSPVFVLGKHREEDFTEADIIVKNPGVPVESKFVQLALEKGIPVESDVSLFFHFYPDPIIAVTGTRGKSTTAAMIHAILKVGHPNAVLAGNIAVSPLEQLEELLASPDKEPVVLELSSWLIDSLSHLKRRPDIAVLTNVYEDHLDRYQNNFELYKQSKAALFTGQNEDQFAVFNYDHDVVKEVAESVKSKKFWYSLKPLPEGLDGAYAENGEIVLRRGGLATRIMPVAEMRLQGDHNLSNALAATIVSMLRDATAEQVMLALRGFVGLEGRQQLVREIKGISFINDTTAASPDGAIAALKFFNTDQHKGIVLLAGGFSRKLSFAALADKIAGTCKHVVLLPGNATADLENAIAGRVPTTASKNMKDAVQKAAKLAHDGDLVLLSPGAPSFGEFKNEFDRGGQFVDAVKALKEAEMAGEATVT